MTYDPILNRYYGVKNVVLPASTREKSGYICSEVTAPLQYIWYQTGGINATCVFAISSIRPPEVTCPVTTANSDGVNTGALYVAGVRTGAPFFISITVVTGIKSALYGDYEGTITFTLSE